MNLSVTLIAGGFLPEGSLHSGPTPDRPDVSKKAMTPSHPMNSLVDTLPAFVTGSILPVILAFFYRSRTWQFIRQL